MRNGTRRTTLTLPAKALAAAERVARKRHVTVSVVVSEALEEKLRAAADARREGERRLNALNAYRQALSRLTEQELSVLDGATLPERADGEF